MNTVDLCPVGALTSKDFRFKMRVWFLKETKTIDVDCGTGTNITLWTREDKVYRITPRQNDAVNSCWMPDSHRLNYKYINAETRIPQPVIRTDAEAPPPPLHLGTGSGFRRGSRQAHCSEAARHHCLRAHDQ